MRSLNRVVLIGNLAADPDVRETTSGKTVVNFAIATNYSWKNGDGETESSTDYHKIVAWNKLGEICGKYLKKGSSIYLEGRIKNRSYETKEGEKKFFTEIIATDVNILTWKKNGSGQPDPEVKSLKEEDSDDLED